MNFCASLGSSWRQESPGASSDLENTATADNSGSTDFDPTKNSDCDISLQRRRPRATLRARRRWRQRRRSTRRSVRRAWEALARSDVIQKEQNREQKRSFSGTMRVNKMKAFSGLLAILIVLSALSASSKGQSLEDPKQCLSEKSATYRRPKT